MRRSLVRVGWAILLAAVLALTALGARLFVAGHGQCERRCRALFSDSRGGQRQWLHRDLCSCSRSGSVEVEVSRSNPGTGPIDPGPTVCGVDHVTYPDERAARLHTTPLHAGACGACSNDADIAVYRSTAATLTGIAEHCAFINTVFGESAGRDCLIQRAGLSEGCTRCWVDNMSCTAAHCLGVCLKSRWRGDPRNLGDGRLNDCLACDEAYCGGPFIECAGANRRRAGILSDIGRPNAQVWGGRE